MSELHIKANLRDTVGKAFAGRLRREGKVPCVLYGIEKDSIKLSVSRREFEKLISETRSVFVVDYESHKQRVIVKDIQYHPVQGDIIHVDLQRVKAGQEITVSLPLKFIGSAPGVKLGGLFQELRADLDISCLPKYMPDELEVDISGMNMGDTIHVSDLAYEHITIKTDSHLSVCTVAAPKMVEEEEEEGAEEEERDEDAEPEVITSKSRKEDEEGGSEG